MGFLLEKSSNGHIRYAFFPSSLLTQHACVLGHLTNYQQFDNRFLLKVFPGLQIFTLTCYFQENETVFEKMFHFLGTAI